MTRARYHIVRAGYVLTYMQQKRYLIIIMQSAELPKSIYDLKDIEYLYGIACLMVVVNMRNDLCGGQ